MATAADPFAEASSAFGNPAATGPSTNLPPPPPPSSPANSDMIRDLLNDPDGNACDTLSLDPEIEVIAEPGNLLVIFDRSISMEQRWGAVPRWQSAGQALVDALMPLACDPSVAVVDQEPCVEELSVAAIMFPTVGGLPYREQLDFATSKGDTSLGSCRVDALDSVEQIPWTGTWDFIQRWNAFWAAGAPTSRLEIGTPINMAFDVADAELSSRPRAGNTAVVVLTDGDPICAQGQAADITAAEWLGNLGVSTYVVGLPGEWGGPALGAIASAGGTGQPIAPTEPDVLTQAIQDIAFSTVRTGFNTCSLPFDPANLPEEPEKVLLFATNNGDGMQYQVPRDRAGGGWALAPDGSVAELEGTLCDEATGGELSNLTFVLTCPDADLPPPLPPVL
jgi:hypothetical protein